MQRAGAVEIILLSYESCRKFYTESRVESANFCLCSSSGQWPFWDPGLYIHLRLEGRAIVFDLGQNEALSATEMLRVSHVFVSHCHMDHFFGFDRLLRMFLARDKTLHLFGPPGIIECVAGKLRGYTWNLVDGYSFAIEVTQVGRETMQRTRFQAGAGFCLKSCHRCHLLGHCSKSPIFWCKPLILIIGLTH